MSTTAANLCRKRMALADECMQRAMLMPESSQDRQLWLDAYHRFNDGAYRAQQGDLRPMDNPKRFEQVNAELIGKTYGGHSGSAFGRSTHNIRQGEDSWTYVALILVLIALGVGIAWAMG